MKIAGLILSATLALGSSAVFAADSSSKGASQDTTGTGSTSGMSGQQQDSTTDTQQGQQLPADMSASRFQALDQNGDGYVSREEAGADPQLTVIFLDVDSNSDEQLSADEFGSYGGAEERSR